MSSETVDVKLSVENLAERLENIETALFALKVNSASLESEPFEDPEEDLGSELETMSLAQELENYIDGLGLRFFKGCEFSPYWKRTCGNVRNSPPPRSLWKNIAPTLAVLERLRGEIDAPIIITSSYRDSDYNACVGGVGDSHHSAFRAVDFVVKKGTPSIWAAKLRSYRGQHFTWNGGSFEFRGGVGKYSNFVHLDTRGWDSTW